MKKLASRIEEIEKALPSVFTPSSPVLDARHLHGRDELVQRIASMVASRGRALIVYGDRHVGKTSLASIATEKVTLNSSYYSASNIDSFATIRPYLLRELATRETTQVKDLSLKGAKLGAFGSSGELKHEKEETRSVERQIRAPETHDQVAKHVAARIVVIDDFEKIRKETHRREFFELIKKMSDNRIEKTLILVAQVDRPEDLLSDYSSFEECLASLKVPRFERSMIAEIIDAGLAELEVKITTTARDYILEYSQNYPNAAHKYCEGAIHVLLDRIRGGARKIFTITMAEINIAELYESTVG